MTRKKTAKAFLVSALLVGSFASAAQTPRNASSVFDNKHTLSIGGTRQATQITLSATTENFSPSPLTLDDLGLSKRDTSYFVDYRYRLKPRWSIFAGAYAFSGSGEKVSSRDFNFDGVEYAIDTTVRANLDIDAYMVDVLYSVYHSENVEVLVGGGIHALDFGVTLAGSVQVNEGVFEARSSGATLLAPVPNVRTSATWVLSERFALNAVGGWMSADVDEYEGDFSYAHIRGFYYFTEHFGASLGYQLTDIDVRQTRTRSVTDVNAHLDGPTLTLTYSF